MKSNYIYFLLFFTSCNKLESDKNLQVINKDKHIYDSLQNQNQILLNKIDSLEKSPKFKETNDRLLIGSWILDYDAYTKKKNNPILENYITQLKEEVSEFIFVFNEDNIMSINSKLRNQKDEISRTKAIYKLKNNNVIEIIRDGSEFVLDEAIQRDTILSISNSNLVMKSNDIIYYFKKIENKYNRNETF